jgi:uncharacterized protein (DUF58 family)
MAKQQKQQTFLDPETISKAEALGLQARLIVEGYMAGEHKSPFRGFAIEFTQHREYVPGDDTRHLDWKVLGRTDRYYLKQYEQETNYVAHVLLDGSESMNYGSGSITKLHYGKMLAACLSYLVLLQRDAVAVNIFDSTVRSQIPRTGNMASIHNIMGVLSRFQAKNKTNLGTVLHDLSGRIQRKGIVVIISDCFQSTEDEIIEGIQHVRFGGSEVILLHVMDPLELDFNFKGLVEFDGLEAMGKALTRPVEIRKSYLREVESFCTRLREGCEKNDCHYQLVNTRVPLAETLTGYLAFRHKTLRR